MTVVETSKKITWQMKGEEPKYISLDELNKSIIKSSDLYETKEKRKKESPSFIIENFDLENEKWADYPQELFNNFKSEYTTRQYKDLENIDTIMVSNFGRVKIDGIIEEQEDQSGKTGYLQLKKYPGLGMIYQLVAETWLEKPIGICSDCILDVHHITNNGYDNGVENLIWLNRCDHSRIDHKIKE